MFGKIVSYAKAVASRGFTDKKTDVFTKQLRVISCFGNTQVGGELPPCEHLKKSKTEGKFYCGGCGCGDRKGTWLVSDGEEYSKLDYPNLTCPLKMPGFTNYRESSPEEAVHPISRRYYIESMKNEEIEKISVTTPDVPVEVLEDIAKKLKKSKENT